MSNLTGTVEVGEDGNDAQTNVTRQSFDTTGLASGPYQSHAVDDFFTDDEGNSLFRDALSTVTNSSTFSFGRIFSRLSLATTDSVAEHLATGRGDRIMPLAELCDIIDGCKSLEAAEILSVECYREWSSMGILHRTLIFALRRSGRHDVWLRIDRRRSRTVSLPAFIANRGKTEANDVAQLASAKSVLLRRSDVKPENRIDFTSPPNLGIFSFYFRAICAEMLEYRIWPENCWFMCSLLQEYLIGEGSGMFVSGSKISIEPFSPVRSRIWLRRYNNLPIPANMRYALTRIGQSETLRDRELLRLWVRRHRLFPNESAFDHVLSGCIYSEMPYVHEVLMILYAKHFASHRPDLNPLLQRRSAQLSAVQAAILTRVPTEISPVRAIELLTAIESFLCNHDSSDYEDPLEIYQRVISPKDSASARLGVSIARALYSGIKLAAKLEHLGRLLSVSDPAASRICIDEAHAIRNESHSWYATRAIAEGPPRYGAKVWSVAISPDAKIIASGSNDRTINLWNAHTGDSIGEPFRGHKYSVQSVTFSPDGRQVISGSDDGTLRRWDPIAGREIGPRMHHASFDVITCVTCSADGKLIASASNDRTIYLWNPETGEKVGSPLMGHTDWVWSIAFSPNGQKIVSGSGDNTVRLWDVSTGETVGEPLEGHTATVFSVAFSPDGEVVVSASEDNSLRRWFVATGQPVGGAMQGHASAVYSVAFSPDGKTIVSGSRDRTVRVWNAITGKSIGEPLIGHTGRVTSVAFSSDGQQIVSGSYDQGVRMWKLLDLDQRRDAN